MPAAILLGAATFVTLFGNIHPSIFRVDLLPFVDRYSIGAGVLVPLALFHFFKSRTNMFASRVEREMTGLLSDWFLTRQADAEK